MKKVFALAALTLAVFSFSSCKKDYTCTCKATGLQDVVLNINKAKKSDAKSTCDQATTTYSAAGYSCELN